MARDLREAKITPDAAESVYGIVLAGGTVDEAATTAERARRRDTRRDRSQAPASLGKTDLTSARRLDDNLVEPVDGGLACGHCGDRLSTAAGDPAVAVHEGPPSDAGPQIIADAADYVDARVVFRQYCCLSCWTALYSGVVPADHPHTLTALGHRTATPAG
ncbi:hypothetical protein [Amycolatopsis sp. DSM 110486]|uniref:hypothetical protein n=1 Tax=Amycolatopsis sp. DSM 110486 TaxID=2865832 RepID=UPI001C6A29B5|nr:hypothetical protein [Amycolatopsis sp. DSM 110486]QYN21394.1 hypothetical protein K1T34_02220 [Amycolatopsis sp. DSM 110486]